jgi:hypothetical protein
MIDIPQNNSADLIAKQNSAHQAELDVITQQILKGLKNSNWTDIPCTEHMIGYHGSTEYHHLTDAIEVAKEFKKKGYFCYYQDGINSYGVNNRTLRVQKVPMSETDRTSSRNRSFWWHTV